MKYTHWKGSWGCLILFRVGICECCGLQIQEANAATFAADLQTMQWARETFTHEPADLPEVDAEGCTECAA